MGQLQTYPSNRHEVAIYFRPMTTPWGYIIIGLQPKHNLISLGGLSAYTNKRNQEKTFITLSFVTMCIVTHITHNAAQATKKLSKISVNPNPHLNK